MATLWQRQTRSNKWNSIARLTFPASCSTICQKTTPNENFSPGRQHYFQRCTFVDRQTTLKKRRRKNRTVFPYSIDDFSRFEKRKNYNDVIKFRKRELLTLVNPWLELFRGVGIQKLRPSQGESKLLDISKYNLLPSGKTTSGLVSCRAHDKGQKLFKSQTDFVPAPLEQPPRGCPAQL